MSFPRYPKYKDSGVQWLGEVPAHWEVMRVKHLVCSIEQGWSPQCEGYPVETLDEWGVLKVGCVNGGTFNPAENKVLPSELAPVPTLGISAGDLLISRANTPELVGSAAVAVTDYPKLLLCDKLYRLRVVARLASPTFMSFYLGSHGARGQIELGATGASSSMVNIGQSTILELEVAVPPVDEQHLMATILHQETAKIDGLIHEQQRLIELLKEKRQAVISHAVTKGLNPHAPMKPSGIEWLGDVPAHWEVKRIKNLVKSIEQGWSPQCEGYAVESEREWGVLKVGCVNGGIFNPLENKVLPAELDPVPSLGISAGDLLISRANTRELVGSAAVADKNFPQLLLCDKLYRLRLQANFGMPLFLSLFLGSCGARSQIEVGASGSSASMLNIGQSVILELEIAVPSVEEQTLITQAMAKEIGNLDTLTAEAQRAIDLLQERRTALISAAVTGKIDVRGWVAKEAA